MLFYGSVGKHYHDTLKSCPYCGAPNVLQEHEQGSTTSSADFQTVRRSAGPYGFYRLEDLPEGFVVDERYEVKAKVDRSGGY